jgi:peroxiredoxin
VSRLLRWYGASPLHLLTMIGSFALAGYAAVQLLPVSPFGILVWLVAAVIGHDLLLMPLYTLADRSVMAVFRHRPLKLPAVPWINYLRVPAVLSGVLLLIWFPLILRLPGRFTASTTLPLGPYLWHWLAVTGALFLLSATALAARLGAARRGAHALKNVTPPMLPDPATGKPAVIASPALPGPATGKPAVIASPALPGPATGKPAVIAPIGTVLPDAELLDVHGMATTLYAVAGDSSSVLVFYRGAWCPFSNDALSIYQQQLLPQLAERGINLVAISAQKPDGSLIMQQRHGLAFTVVSDPGNTIAARLGILTQPSEKCRAAQVRLGLDLTNVNADGTAALPMPATVILGTSHTVRWIDVHPGYGPRTEPQQIISALDHLEH